MFGFLKKRPNPMSGAEMAEEGLRQIAAAVKNNAIKLQQGRVSADIHVHLDNPGGSPRFTYILFSPTVPNQVVARCVILLDRAQGQTPIWQIDWAVFGHYRRQGFGLAVAAKALTEFTTGMKGKLNRDYVIEAIVDQGNEASIRIARTLLGGEQVLSNQNATGKVHSFIKQFSG